MFRWMKNELCWRIDIEPNQFKFISINFDYLLKKCLAFRSMELFFQEPQISLRYGNMSKFEKWTLLKIRLEIE